MKLQVLHEEYASRGVDEINSGIYERESLDDQIKDLKIKLKTAIDPGEIAKSKSRITEFESQKLPTILTCMKLGLGRSEIADRIGSTYDSVTKWMQMNKDLVEQIGYNRRHKEANPHETIGINPSSLKNASPEAPETDRIDSHFDAQEKQLMAHYLKLKGLTLDQDEIRAKQETSGLRVHPSSVSRRARTGKSTPDIKQ